ncbi:MFS transporter [Bacillus sp. REN16]|uniref:MFS transporter n=1 Tax=Bacillus sp. REN16 TaxID=2887296 RepID=UPI001E50C38A|nr:MFS transporter [Bacillus sp. REN16]MCC3355527.1 MFS transporter [Bacillus sp. REN16]
MKRLFFVASLLIITGVFVASNIYTFIPLYQNIADSLHISVEQAVIGGSIFSFSYACGLLFFGPLSEKIGRKTVILLGLILAFFFTGLVGFSFDEKSLYLFRSLQGFALGSFPPVAFAYIFDAFPLRHRTLVLALINCGFLFAGILGQLISSSITYFYGWEHVFYCFAIIYLFLFICGLFFLPTVPVAKQATTSLFQDLFIIMKNPSLIICYLITFSVLLTFISFYDGISQYLYENYSIDQQIIFKIRALGLVGASFSLLTGKLVRLFGDRRTLLMGLFLVVLSLSSLLFIRTPGIIAFMSIPFIAAISLLYPALISIIGKLGEHARGSAISVYSFTLMTGGSLGALLASALDFPILIVSLIGLFTFSIAVSVRLKL